METFNYNLKNKVVLLTGASKGLGYETAKHFVKNGSNLIICARDSKKIKKTFKQLQKIKNKKQKIIYSVTDVSSLIEVKKLVNLSIKEFGKIDVLVNNAAIIGPKGHIEKVNWKDFLKTIKINLLGSILLCRTVIPYFKKRNKGKIIQLSGGGGVGPSPMLTSYAISKVGIVRFIENLSEEIKKFNIDVNAVAPGIMLTDMLNEMVRAGPKKIGKDNYKKFIKAKKSGETNFKKICELILFLSSRYSDGISGKIISATWDNWKKWIKYKKFLKNSDIYTLRRIVGKDRGFKLGDNSNY